MRPAPSPRLAPGLGLWLATGLGLWLGSGCAPAEEPLPGARRDWSGVVSAGPAPPVVGLTRGADGASVARGEEDRVCPPGSEWLGGLGREAVCALPAGHVVSLTRDLAGRTLREVGGAALCPSGTAFLGSSGEIARCAGEGPAMVALVSAAPAGASPGAEFGPPPGGCATEWEALGALDFATVCRRAGEGVVAALSRDAAGLQVRDAPDPAALCPAGATNVGRAGEAVLCAREGAGTAIAIAWDEAQTPALGAPPCPEGWTAWGGLDAATVCWHPASLPVARLARGPDGAGWPALLDGQAPCPAGYAPAGGAGQALVCVGLGDGD